MSERQQWVYGREGMPASPGIRSVAPPARPALSARQQWFKDLKFGMFIHWGVESIVARHPELAPQAAPWAAAHFDPRAVAQEFARLGERFDPASWADLAERAGQRYLVFTAKHHLGLANFAAPADDFTTVALGPRRDFLRPLADECHRRRMPLFAYYSLPDLRHPDCRPLDDAAWRRYARWLLKQLQVLAAEYAPLAGLWLDPGPWNGPAYRYPMAEIRRMLRERFPDMLAPGDWDGAERTFSRRAFLDDSGMVLDYELFPQGSGPQPDAWPFEVCDTIGDSWFHHPADVERKDAPTLIRRLVEAVGRGGNYLLNQGPLPSGEPNPDDAASLAAIGAWLRRHGEAIYDTRPLGTPAQPWGWPVVKGDLVYLHILDWPGERLALPGLSGPVQGARWLDGSPIAWESTAGSVVLHLPEAPPDAVDAIAVLDLERERRRAEP